MTKTKTELRLCSTRGCQTPISSRRLCLQHYCAWWREHRLNDPVRQPRCDVCEGPHHAFGLCMKHYKAWRYWGDPRYVKPPMPTQCLIEGCDMKPMREGHCGIHRFRIRKYGDPHMVGKRGAKPKLLAIPQEIRSLSSAYIYSYTTGAERTPEMIAGHAEYQRLRKQLASAA